MRLADGVLIIDNPGMREIQLWESEETLDQAFDDVTTLAADCRFRDCAHDRSPGCAVRAAIALGRAGGPAPRELAQVAGRGRGRGFAAGIAAWGTREGNVPTR